MEPRKERDKEREFEERVIQIDRVSRTVAGGRRLRFRAVVMVGNKRGKIGLGVAKAADTTTSVNKATKQAYKHIIVVSLKDATIPHQVTGRYGNATVLLKPAKKGTFIIAGGVVRSIAELIGIENLSAKMLGSSNKINNARATLSALTIFLQR